MFADFIEAHGWSILFIFAFQAILISGAIWLWIWTLRVQRRALLMELPKTLPPETEVITEEHDGVEYRLVYQPPQDPLPGFLHLSRSCDFSGHVIITAFNRRQEQAARWGLGFRLGSGDRSFETRCSVFADDPDDARRFLSAANHRDAVRQILDAGYDMVVVQSNRVAAIRDKQPTAHLEIARFTTPAAAPLQVLSGNSVPETGVAARRRGIQWWRVRRWIAYLVPLLAFIAIIPSSVLATHRPIVYLPEHAALTNIGVRWGVITGVLFLPVGVFLVRGRSGSNMDAFRIMILSVAGFAVGGMAAPMTLNQLLDRSPASTYEVPIIQKFVRGKTTDRKFTLRVASWTGKRSFEEIWVYPSEYRRARPGSRLVVTTKPGWLGYEWVVGYRVERAMERPRSTMSFT